MVSYWGFVDRTEALKRLRAMMSRYLHGSGTDLVTPLIRGDDKPTLAREKLAREVWRECDLSQLPMWLRERECSNRDKIGTFSIFPPYELALAASVEKYFVKHPCNLNAKAARFADGYVGSILTRVPHCRLDLLTLEDAAMRFDGRSGLGWPVNSSDPAYLGKVMEMSSSVLETLDSDNVTAFPYILGSRGQSAGPDLPAKVRAIFQGSRVIGNLEKMIQVPVLSSLRHAGPFAAWNGKADVDFAITQMFERDQGAVLSLDFSNFDASVPNEVLTRQFAILCSWFEPAAIPVIRFVEKSFMRAGIFVPQSNGDGFILKSGQDRCGGIPSGSVLTNLIGSMVNIWAMAYASHRCGLQFTDLQVQGDDGVYAFRGYPDIGALSSVLLEDLGMVMHVDKNFVASREIHFLQNVHRKSYIVGGLNVGVRPLMRVLNSMMSYERFTPGWNGYLDSIRWVQQLDNAYRHPCFKAFAGWLVSQDKYLSSMPLQDIIEAAGGMGFVISKLGALPMGSNKTSIRDLAKSPAAKAVEYQNFSDSLHL